MSISSEKARKVQFEAFAAPPELAHAVRECWFLSDEGLLSAGLPKPYVELVVSISGRHFWRASREGPEHEFTLGWVTPLQSAPRFARSDGRRTLVGARLEPWAAFRIFGNLPVGDGLPPISLERMIGQNARDLQRNIRTAGSPAACTSILVDWLRPHLANLVAPLPALGAPGQMGAGELAHANGVTPRTLRRRFSSIGLSGPKRWLRLHRLDRVLRDISLPEATPLAELALDNGYSDQSHFNREVSNLTGAAPSRLRRRGKDLPPHFLPLD